MGDDVFVDGGALTGLADAIRGKTGKREKMYPREMAGEVGSIDTSEAEAADAAWINRTLGDVTVPDGTARVWDYMFYGNEQLVIESLPETVTQIGIFAFYNCKKLALDKLPSKLTSIARYSFYGCESLAVKELPLGLTVIDSAAFCGCDSLGIKELPAGVTTIGGWAFAGCTALGIKELPAGLTTLGGCAFKDCVFSSMTFLGKPKTIANNAFDKTLTVINVPWAEGEVANAPWGATKATINYNFKEGNDGGGQDQ